MLALYASIFGYETSNLESELGLQMYESMITWSPFDGLGAYTSKVLFKSFFWLCVSGAFVALATAFWKRGHGRRTNELHQTPRAIVLLLLGSASLWSARVVHQENLAWERSRLRPQNHAMRASYERALSQYQDLRAPTFEDMHLDLALRPESSSYDYRWSAPILQQSFETESTLFVQTPIHDQCEVRLDNTRLQPKHAYPELGAQIFQISENKTRQLLSTLSISATHQFEGQPKKRNHPLGVITNGTYLSQKSIPTLSYEAEVELDSDLIRASHQLPPRTRSSLQDPPGHDCPLSGRRQRWSIEISTSLAQQAIAPGKLEKTWTQDGRQHFLYRSEHLDCSEFAFASADYQTLSSTWTIAPNRLLQGEVKYLAGYETQAHQIEKAVGRALTRLSSILGPYPYSSLKVVQVRNDADLGVSPANILFLREQEAWSLRLEEQKDEHQRLYYITTRLAQHWLHNKLAPANAPGKGLFIEGIPTFLAYTWLGELFGESWLQKKYLRRAMRRYFWYHGTHTSVEEPIVTSPLLEHIHVYKAALALRVAALALRVAARSIGSEKMHSILRSLLSAPPSQAMTASDFAQALEQALSPKQEPSLAQEMLHRIVHYDNRLESAQARRVDNDRVLLRLNIQANRWETKADAPKPKRIPWNRALPLKIQFGPSSDQKQQLPEHIESLIVHNGSNEIEIELKAMPTQVWIDPSMQLLDLSLKDQRMQVTELGS